MGVRCRLSGLEIGEDRLKRVTLLEREENINLPSIVLYEVDGSQIVITVVIGYPPRHWDLIFAAFGLERVLKWSICGLTYFLL